MIGGATTYDTNDTALQAIIAEWTARRSFAVRVNNLTNGWGLNGQYVLRLDLTVQADDARDSLYGGSDSDWFLFFITDSLMDYGSKDC